MPSSDAKLKGLLDKGPKRTMCSLFIEMRPGMHDAYWLAPAHMHRILQLGCIMLVSGLQSKQKVHVAGRLLQIQMQNSSSGYITQQNAVLTL